MSRKKGDVAEEKASEYLKKQGYKIIDRNFYTRFGEIDIIAQKDSVLHFVEVKSGKNFDPIYNITPVKMERILKSVSVYLTQHAQLESAYCVDAVIVREDMIELVENLTLN